MKAQVHHILQKSLFGPKVLFSPGKPGDSDEGCKTYSLGNVKGDAEACFHVTRFHQILKGFKSQLFIFFIYERFNQNLSQRGVIWLTCQAHDMKFVGSSPTSNKKTSYLNKNSRVVTKVFYSIKYFLLKGIIFITSQKNLTKLFLRQRIYLDWSKQVFNSKTPKNNLVGSSPTSIILCLYFI